MSQVTERTQVSITDTLHKEFKQFCVDEYIQQSRIFDTLLLEVSKNPARLGEMIGIIAEGNKDPERIRGKRTNRSYTIRASTLDSVRELTKIIPLNKNDIMLIVMLAFLIEQKNKVQEEG